MIFDYLGEHWYVHAEVLGMSPRRVQVFFVVFQNGSENLVNVAQCFGLS